MMIINALTEKENDTLSSYSIGRNDEWVSTEFKGRIRQSTLMGTISPNPSIGNT